MKSRSEAFARGLELAKHLEYNEGDFHEGCMGTFVRTPTRRFRVCGYCGEREPGPEIYGRVDGRTVVAPPDELGVVTRRRK